MATSPSDPVRSTPQQVADGLREKTKDSSRDGAFIKTFLLAFFVVVGMGALTSYLVNPYGHFAPTRYAPRVPQDRDEKLELFRALKEVPEAVIIGSSHLKKFDPQCLSRHTNLRAFNFAVDGGGLEDVEAVMRILDERAVRPKVIVLGLSPGVFSYVTAVPIHSLWSRHFSKYVDTTLEERVNAVGTMLWSQSALLDDLAVIRRGHERNRSHRHRDDGFLDTPKEDELVHNGTFDLPGRLLPSIARLVPIFRRMNVDPARADRLRKLIERARARGSDVMLVVPPLHPALVSALRANPNELQPLRDVDAFAERLAADGIVKYRATALADFGGTENDFLDADHMNSRNTARLLDHVFGRGLCAVQ